MAAYILVTSVFVYICFLISKEISATMNVAAGKQVYIEDDWQVFDGELNNIVDKSIRRCVELEPVPGSTNTDLVIVSIDLQNFTHIVEIDINSDPTSKQGVVFNYTDQDTANENECEVNRKCNTIGRWMAFPFQPQPVGIVRICEIKIFGCPVGYYGNECSQKCGCLSGECDPDSGHCSDGQCIDGWIGSSCDIACPGGTYGSNCSSTCKGNCFGAMPCNPVTGDCQSGCTEGWTGQKCDTRIGATAAELLNIQTTIGLVVMASMIMILLGFVIYCLLKRSPKPDEGDTGRRGILRRIFHSVNGTKSLGRKNTKHEDEEDQQRISCTDMLEAEYMDLNDDNNTKEQIQLPTTKKAAKAAAKKHQVTDHYDSLVEKDDPSDLHFYHKKGQQNLLHQSASLHNTSMHQTSSLHNKNQHQASVSKVSLNSSNEYVIGFENNASSSKNKTPNTRSSGYKDSAKQSSSMIQPREEFSSPLQTENNANLYLEPMEYQQKAKPRKFKGVIKPKNENIYDDAPEVQAPKPSVKAVVKRLNSNHQTNNNGPISPKMLTQNSVKKMSSMFNAANGGFDSKEKQQNFNRTQSVQIHGKNHMTNGNVHHDRHDNSTTEDEPVYDQPDHQYDYVDVPPQKSRNLYPSLVRNGIKLPMMNFK